MRFSVANPTQEDSIMKKTISTQEIREIFPGINQLKDQDLAEKIALTWKDAFEHSNWDDLRTVWVDPDITRPVYLVDHVNCIAEMSLQTNAIISKYHPESACDEQLLLALALIHDVSKVLEFDPDEERGCRFSELGHQFQHAVIGACLAHEHGLPTQLVHLIHTHTGLCSIKPNYREGVFFLHMDLCHFRTVLYGSMRESTNPNVR